MQVTGVSLFESRAASELTHKRHREGAFGVTRLVSPGIPSTDCGVSRPLARERTCRSFANHGCRSGCFSVQKLAICVAFGSPLRSRSLQFGRGWRNIVTTSCGADRRPDSLPPEDGAGDSVPGSAASLGYTPSPLGPGSIPSSVCPVSRLSSRALRARTLVFTCSLRRQPTAPRRWLAATGGGVESVHGQPYGEDP